MDDSACGKVSQANDLLAWLSNYRESIGCSVEQIDFHESRQWSLDETHTMLRHASGQFFAIQGYRGSSPGCPDFFQPLINQPETGTQGFIVRRSGSDFDVLVQARTEPGNVGLVQIGPTIQATYSNYTAVHKGRPQPFLELFHHPAKFGARVLVDTVQPELGSKFLRKWNRNIVVETKGLSDFADPMFKWVSLSTLTSLMRLNHVVNNDARLVVGLLAMECGPQLFQDRSSFSELVRRSFASQSSPTFATMGEASRWLEAIRTRSILTPTEMPLSELPEWTISDREISHQRGLYFSVIQVRVHAADREVTDWDQPLLAARHKGQIVLLCKEFQGSLCFLLHAEPQIGNASGAELQPTFCFDNEEHQETPAAISQLLNEDQIAHRFSVEASDEGGRFYRCISRYDIRMLNSSIHPELPQSYCWLTLGQMRAMLDGPDVISDESRSILSLFLSAAFSGHFQSDIHSEAA